MKEIERDLEAAELGEPVGAKAVERGGAVARVGQHDGVGGAALRDQLRLVLRTATKGN